MEIIKTDLILDNNFKRFYETLNRKIEDYQREGYRVEVQYSTCQGAGVIQYSAMLLMR